MTATTLELMWTALPRGIDASTSPAQARLSVLMTPQVTLSDPKAAATLADVPDLVDWPATLAGLSFAVAVDTGAGTPTTLPATLASAAPDSALWRALLPSGTAVESRVFDQDKLASRPVLTYHASTVLAHIRNGYTGAYGSSPVGLPNHRQTLMALPALAHGAEPPPLPTAAEIAELDEAAVRARHAALAAELIGHARAGTLPAAVRHAGDLAARLAALTGRPPELLFPSTGTAAEELGRLLAFHAVTRAWAPADSGASVYDAELHAVITLLHDHPAVMSPLGLMLDLTVDAGSLPDTDSITTAQPGLRVTVTAGGGAELEPTTTHYSAWTAFVADPASGFAACPVPNPANGLPELVSGLLNLAAPEVYTLGQVDEDGAVFKALTLSQLTDQDEGGLPALRTTGPSIIRTQYGSAIKSRIDQAVRNQDAKLNSTSPVTLYAEDLVRGYRIDVRDHADGVWRSLHERDASYAVPGLPDITVREEGVTQPAVTPDSLNPQTASHLYVHESVARWEGWSLSVQRPGRIVGDDGPTSAPSAPQPGGVPLTPSFTVVPGSLPRLRFGHAYDVRVRTVDLGGGGLKPADADAVVTQLGETAPVLPGSAAPFIFQRFEPVPSPVPVATEQPSEGESVAQLVIRSSRTDEPAAVAAWLNGLVAGSASDTGIRYFATCVRHLVPPKGAQQVAERAGLLDGLAAPASYFVSVKDEGGLADSAVVDITTGEPVPIPEVPDPFDPNHPRSAVELVGTGTAAYPVHHEAQLIVPYLPDWLAAGAVLRGLPGLASDQLAEVGPDGTLVVSTWAPGSSPDAATGSVTSIPFSGTWPLLEPLRLALADGNGPPVWDPGQRVLTVSLPPAQTATVTLSCSLAPGALDVLGQWQWLTQAGAGNEGIPEASLEQLAQYGLTWPLTPFRQLTLIHATVQPVLDPAITTLVATRQPGETRATLSGHITLDAVSTGQLDLIGSWTDPAASGQSTQPTSAHVLSARLPPDGDIGQLTAGVDGAPDVLTLSGPVAQHELHDTRHRWVSYQAVASSRFAEHFPPQLDPGSMTASSSPLSVDVPSSAAPPAPRVREAVTTWRWDWPDDPSAPHRRYNAGVRVLLEPPWFATGEDEQLAVVLIDPLDGYPPGENVRGLVTHWGADPAFAAPPLIGAPTPEAFTAGGPPVAASIPVPGSEDTLEVVLKPHDVTYDADRDLWVCDIPVATGDAYMPFVRLAIARYQAHSVTGYELSSIVQLPFVQILPDRQVTVTQNGPDSWGLQVDGPSYSASSVMPRPGLGLLGDVQQFYDNVLPVPSLISVTVQERLPGTSDDAGWSNVGGGGGGTAVSGIGTQGASPGEPLWSGSVALDPNRSPGQYRILITEYELLDSDVNAVVLAKVGFPQFDPDVWLYGNSEMYYRPGTQRLVFAAELLV